MWQVLWRTACRLQSCLLQSQMMQIPWGFLCSLRLPFTEACKGSFLSRLLLRQPCLSVTPTSVSVLET